MNVSSKLPEVGTTIFSIMSSLAQDHKAINLSQGFPNFDCPEELKERLSFYMNKGYNQYAPMGGLPQLTQGIAKKTANIYGMSLQYDKEITITVGATQAIFTAIMAFIKPDDEVVIIEPAFDCYRPTIQLAGGFVKAYELEAPHYKIDWERFAKLLSPKTKMVIINTPNNPTGTIWSEDDIKTLEKLTDGTNIIVLSDEVYEHLVYDQQVHQSVLKYPNLQKRSIVTNSFGKTYHCTGWRAGYCIAPEMLMKEFRKVHQYNTFSVFTPLQYALADFIQKKSFYLDLPDFYQKKRDYFLTILAQTRFKALPCQGTYFQLVDYSAISDLPDTEYVKKLVVENGIAAIPVSGFYKNKNDYKVIRFCFAKTKETLDKAAFLLKKI